MTLYKDSNTFLISVLQYQNLTIMNKIVYNWRRSWKHIIHINKIFIMPYIGYFYPDGIKYDESSSN
jgi:hypothetical protein